MKLIQFELYLKRENFAALHETVSKYPLGEPTVDHDIVQRVCSAIDVACIWYWKSVLCLQRSAAATCLLKKHGVFAEMVIGTQQLPFKAHAWVEVNGIVVNDKPYVQQMYASLERF